MPYEYTTRFLNCPVAGASAQRGNTGTDSMESRHLACHLQRVGMRTSYLPVQARHRSYQLFRRRTVHAQHAAYSADIAASDGRTQPYVGDRTDHILHEAHCPANRRMCRMAKKHGKWINIQKNQLTWYFPKCIHLNLCVRHFASPERWIVPTCRAANCNAAGLPIITAFNKNRALEFSGIRICSLVN